MGPFYCPVNKSILIHIHKRNYKNIRCVGDLPTSSVHGPLAHGLDPKQPQMGLQSFSFQSPERGWQPHVRSAVLRLAFCFDLSCFYIDHRPWWFHFFSGYKCTSTRNHPAAERASGTARHRWLSLSAAPSLAPVMRSRAPPAPNSETRDHSAEAEPSCEEAECSLF